MSVPFSAQNNEMTVEDIFDERTSNYDTANMHTLQAVKEAGKI